jgi:hypothetical protein
MKMIVLWDVAPCSLVQIDRRFRGVYCLHHTLRHENMKYYLFHEVS